MPDDGIREVLEIFEPDRDDHVLGIDNLIVLKSRLKSSCFTQMIQTPSIDSYRRDLFLIPEPLCISEIEVDRKRFDLSRGQAFDAQEILDRVLADRVEMPITGRAKIHAFRHVHLPELHWVSNQLM